MTKIEEVIRQVSDLRDFYIKIQRMKKVGGQMPESPGELNPPSSEDRQRANGNEGEVAHGASDTLGGSDPG